MIAKFFIWNIVLLFAASFLHAADTEPKKKRKSEHHAAHEPKAKRQRVNAETMIIPFRNVGNVEVVLAREGRLGKGKNGKVQRAQILGDTPTWVAAKIQPERFEKEEIEGCARAGQLVAKPVRYKDKDGVRNYVYLQKIINGVNLQQYLHEKDQKKKRSLEKINRVKENVYNALSSRVHKKLVTFNDANIENIMVDDDGEIQFIDFGNALIWNKKALDGQTFEQYCSKDYMMVDAAIFIYLEGAEYSIDVQNKFWIRMFLDAKEVFEFYKDDKSIFDHETVVELMYRFTDGLVPEFLQSHYDEDTLLNATDEEISEIINNLTAR